MARKIALRVELLEVRTLLSDLSFTVTTDKSAYQVGQPVQLTFTETNVSNEPVTVNDGPSIDGFTVTQNGQATWESNAGNTWPNIQVVTLEPGKSLTETATWNGEPGDASSVAETGSFSVTNQLAPQSASASFQITSPLTYTLTTDKPAYQLGEPVQITLTATNPLNQAVSAIVVPVGLFIGQSGSSLAEIHPKRSGLRPDTPDRGCGAIDQADRHVERLESLARSNDRSLGTVPRFHL